MKNGPRATFASLTKIAKKKKANGFADSVDIYLHLKVEILNQYISVEISEQNLIE